MNEELKALSKIRKLLIKEYQYLVDIVEKAFTPPTEQEVCKALEEYYKIRYDDVKVRYVEEQYNEIDSLYNYILHQKTTRKFIASFFHGEHDGVQAIHVIVEETNMKTGESKEVVNRVIIQEGYFSHPPYLIALVSRFYEGKGGN